MDQELGLALLNPTFMDATVTLTLRGYDGSLIQGTGIVNPVLLTLPASKQKAMLAQEIFGQAITGKSGWIELSMSSPTISGFFLIFDPAFTFIDGTDLVSNTSNRLFFPNASPSSIISFVNTGIQPLNVSVSLYDNDGHLFKTQQLNLAPLSGFSGPVDTLIPGIAGFEGYAVVDSGSDPRIQGSLIGVETFRNTSDIAMLKALQISDQLQIGYIAHLVTQGQWTSTLTLVNPDAVPQTVRITAAGLEEGGRPRPVSSQTIERVIPPNGRLSESVDTLFNFTAQALLMGDIRYEVTSNTNGLLGYLAYGTTDGTVLAAAPAQGKGYSDLFFAQVAEGADYFTGLAVLNPNPESAVISFDTFDANGTQTGSTVVTLDPGERRARLFSELLGNFQQVGGYARLSSTRPIFTYELFGSRNPKYLANVSAQGVLLNPQYSGTVVASTGAQVLSSDGLTSVIITPSALPADTVVEVSTLTTDDLPQILDGQFATDSSLRTGIQVQFAGTRTPIGNVHLKPTGMQLRTPLRVMFPTRVQLKPGAQVPMFIYNPSTKQYSQTNLFASADESGRTVSAKIGVLGTYVVALPIDQILPPITVGPNRGAAGATINVSGSGFRSSPTENTVTFAGRNNSSVFARIVAASPNLLTVEVPARAVTGSVMTMTGTQTSFGVPFKMTADDSTTTPPPVNQRPTVNAGSNQTITLPAKAVLNGAANDDGLPVGSTLTTTWSMVSGPGTVTFGNINALSTDASFSAAGNYVLRLTASDGALSTSADVSIIVNPAPPVTPAPPVPVFTFSPSSPVVGSPISFNASSSTCHASPCSYNWTDDADKSVLGTGATMSFTFSVVGPKYVRLTVTDAQSQTASVEHDVIVSG
ncbi:MAG: hypothetical protein DMG15_03455, partial [Acidobacteria bacterium]